MLLRSFSRRLSWHKKLKNRLLIVYGLLQKNKCHGKFPRLAWKVTETVVLVLIYEFMSLIRKNADIKNAKK